MKSAAKSDGEVASPADQPTQLRLTLERPAPAWLADTVAIDQARILAGLSYQQLAAKARIDRMTLSDFLNGRRQPTLGTIHRVLRSLDLDPKDVFRFTRPGPSRNEAA